jgi:NAD(P)-dependent dehydrogenase (short-subunit alcohol dehydrogenase family)
MSEFTGKTVLITGTPLQRMTTYAETAAFIKPLASDATAFVSGQTVIFDGGRNMR